MAHFSEERMEELRYEARMEAMLDEQYDFHDNFHVGPFAVRDMDCWLCREDADDEDLEN